MIDVGVYNTSWGTFGGGEKYISLIASIISELDGFKVTLLFDKPGMTIDKLSEYYKIDLDKVEGQDISLKNVTDIMGTYDLGIITSNVRSFGNRAKKNIYVLQIPYYKITPFGMFAKAIRENPKEGMKDILRRALLHDVKKSDLVLVYSEFTKKVLQKYHDVDCKILYPPIDDFYGNGQKKNVILSVGRIFRGVYNDKRYDVMIDSFKNLWPQISNNAWEYRIAGSCASDSQSLHYLEELRDSAKGYPVKFYVNVDYNRLQTLYDEATLFWHAAGYGVNEDKFPERMEHFGMSTVEAMSARCIPVVINKGGQKEIISHGKTGFLWNSLDELIGYTSRIIKDPLAAKGMKEQVRARYLDFDRECFRRNLTGFLKNIRFSDN